MLHRFRNTGSVLMMLVVGYVTALGQPANSGGTPELRNGRHTSRAKLLAMRLANTILLWSVAILLCGAAHSAFAQQPDLVVQVGHNEEVKSIAISRNGTFLVSGSSDGRVGIWDIRTGSQLRVISGQIDKIYAVAISTDDTALATGARDGSVAVWDVATGKQLSKFQLPRYVSSLAFDRDNKSLIVGCADHSVTVWNAKTGTKLASLTGHTGVVTSVAATPDGKIIASGSEDDTIRLWNAANGQNIAALENPGQVLSIAASPDGNYIAGGLTGGEITLWGVKDHKLIRTIKADRFVVDSVAFSPDGKTLASGNSTSSVSLWNVATGDSVARFSYPDDELITNAFSVAFSPDGRSVAAGYRNGRVTVWDIQTASVSRELVGNPFPVFSLSMDKAGALLAANASQSMKLWSLADRAKLQTFTLKNGNSSVALRGDGAVIASFGDDGISLWDVTTGNKLYGLGPGETAVFSPDGKMLVGGIESPDFRVPRFNVWDTTTGDELNRFIWFANGIYYGIRSLAFSPDGSRLASYGDFSGEDGHIKLWDAASRKEIWTSPRQLRQTKALDFSPDGQILACGVDDGTVMLLNSKDGSVIKTLSGHFDDVNSVSFSPDGKLLASGSRDGTIILWDARLFQSIKTLSGHGSFVNSVLFSRDGKFVFSGSTDSTVKIWDVASGSELATLVTFGENDWLVTTPDGFFDGTPAAWKQLIWRFNNNTFDYAPVETYFNDFFYPGLLQDVLAGRYPKPKPGQELTKIDRRQPKVEIERINGLTKDAISEAPDRRESTFYRRSLVEIDVTDNAGKKNEASNPPTSGAQDLRLFRNGLLVSVWHGDLFRSDSGCRSEPPSAVGGPRKVRCTAIVSLPPGDNSFTAYAFNSSNIRSTDVPFSMKGRDTNERTGIFYVLAVGVDKYVDGSLNLNFAVADVSEMAKAIAAQQQKLLGQKYTSTQLIRLTDELATKDNILAALNRFKNADERSIPDGTSPPLKTELEKIKRAEPEDAIVIYYAGHGAAAGDRFYLLPHNFKERTDGGLARDGISDLELSSVLESIDAGKILMSIDACQSGQALGRANEGKAPMNSKGLAQLAYDKGMFILTAAQSQQAALEVSRLGHGLLTYALLEGLQKADKNLANEIVDRKWLDYAVRTVPELQLDEMRKRDDQIKKGASKRGAEIIFVNGGNKNLPPEKRGLQTPRVFYRQELESYPLVVARP